MKTHIINATFWPTTLIGKQTKVQVEIQTALNLHQFHNNNIAELSIEEKADDYIASNFIKFIMEEEQWVCNADWKVVSVEEIETTSSTVSYKIVQPSKDKDNSLNKGSRAKTLFNIIEHKVQQSDFKVKNGDIYFKRKGFDKLSLNIQHLYSYFSLKNLINVKKFDPSATIVIGDQDKPIISISCTATYSMIANDVDIFDKSKFDGDQVNRLYYQPEAGFILTTRNDKPFLLLVDNQRTLQVEIDLQQWLEYIIRLGFIKDKTVDIAAVLTNSISNTEIESNIKQLIHNEK